VRQVSFSLVTNFVHGLAHVRINRDEFAYIDRTGKRIFTYKGKL
jgi:hypothetical protein